MPWRVYTHDTHRLKTLPKRCQCIGAQLATNRVAAHSSPHMTMFSHAYNKGPNGQAYLIGQKGQFGFSNLHFPHADSVPVEAVLITVVCLEAADELYALAHPITVISESITCKTWIDLKQILTGTS